MLIDGVKKRKRKFFKTKSEANKFKKTQDANQIRYGEVTDFDLERYHRLSELENTLANGQLEEAVAFYRQHNPMATDLCVRKATKQFLKDKKEQNVSTEWITTMKGYLDKLNKYMGKQTVVSVTPRKLKNFLSSLKYTVSYKDNVRRVLRTFFEWLRKDGYIKTNPAKDLDAYIVSDKVVKYLHYKDCEKILRYMERERPDLVPFTAISAFAGMRTSHIKRLSWDNIDFEDKGIRVESKGKAERDFIDEYPENLWLWLEKYKQYPISKYNTARERGSVISLLEIDYPRNGFRHAFGTYHSAVFKKVSLVTLLMQHKGNPRTFYKFYKGVCRPREGERYFSIVPTN